MYNNTEYKLLEQIYINPGIHKRQLTKNLNMGMPSINYGLKKINKLIKKKKKGNQINFYLDYSKPALTPALTIVEYNRFEKLESKVKLAILDYIETLNKKPSIVILFGSYATGSYTKDSDIDIFLVYPDMKYSKDAEKTANLVNSRYNVEINPVYLDNKSFKESFHNTTKKFFKNLQEGKLIIVGIEWWRQFENEKA